MLSQAAHGSHTREAGRATTKSEEELRHDPVSFSDDRRRREPVLVKIGVPNGRLSQDYWKAALVATSQETVAVDLSGTVALPTPF
jgi:hypothetical protein